MAGHSALSILFRCANERAVVFLSEVLVRATREPIAVEGSLRPAISFPGRNRLFLRPSITSDIVATIFRCAGLQSQSFFSGAEATGPATSGIYSVRFFGL